MMLKNMHLEQAFWNIIANKAVNGSSKVFLQCREQGGETEQDKGKLRKMTIC